MSETEVDEVLEHALQAARDVTGAAYAAIGVFNEDHTGLDRFITLGLDPEAEALIGDRPTGRGLLMEPETLRVEEIAANPHSSGFPPNHPPMQTLLSVPIRMGTEVYGNIYLTEKAGGAAFTATDEAAIEVLADWAALAIIRARSGMQARLAENIAGMEAERRRWSRELHDETLQGLGAIRVLLAMGLRSGQRDAQETAITEALAQLSDEIERLRGLITDLRPAALDDLGMASALEAAVRRAELRDRIPISLAVALAHELGIEPTRLDPDLENAIYRLVQESLRNAGRHSGASTISVSVVERDEEVVVTVEDDGKGFDPSAPVSGFGLQGLRERAALQDAQLRIESSPGRGARIVVSLPAVRAD